MERIKELLGIVRTAERQMRDLREREQICEELARKTGAAGEDLEALREDLRRRVEGWACGQLKAARAIDHVGNPIAREVMRYRYIDGLNWREIEDRMGYTREWMAKAERKALKELEEGRKNFF